MKKYKYGSYAILSLLFGLAFSVNAFANSSWHWLTDAEPYKILPFVVIGTLVVEVLFISRCLEKGTTYKNIFFVAVANIISFLLPYVINGLMCVRVGFDFIYFLNGSPAYTVGFYYLILTLISEIPIVYNGLKKSATDRTGLLKNVFAANCITTVIVAIIERVVCRGSW